MNVESDWCVVCSMPRPGYVDPAVKAEKWKAEADDQSETLQGLPAVQQETRPESRTPVRNALAGGEEAA